MVHVELSLAPEVHQSNDWILPIQSLRTGREQHVPNSSNHPLYLLKLFNSIYPEGNFGGNQLPVGSMSLSPLYPSTTNDLHVPQEFPLTLPFSGIVHHLSGPNRCALTQTTLKITVSCRCTHPSIYFHCACRFNTRKLAHMLDSLVRVSRRVEWGHVVRNEQQQWTVTSITWRLNALHL